ncbi:hypothetical protein BRADI_2g09253v3 [Brachypodium distachyon]|uniref:Uncharacterized protein n=1 Tax=Brachypodium distachyon TaxID=15368 RepID=A0A0Q3FW58_BRADI|nr:hypothetical protein BRADI_2g09253v3 [Brachypodium distachyon]
MPLPIPFLPSSHRKRKVKGQLCSLASEREKAPPKPQPNAKTLTQHRPRRRRAAAAAEGASELRAKTIVNSEEDKEFYSDLQPVTGFSDVMEKGQPLILNMDDINQDYDSNEEQELEKDWPDEEGWYKPCWMCPRYFFLRWWLRYRYG